MPPSIFISYSHEDSSLVGPVVALLRASEALVFQDADSIRPGKRWREEIGTAISGASVVVVFWCCHAEASEEVENEITAAITQKKDILPLLLDETPLPSRLAEFQYIDFRTAFGKGHGPEPEMAPVARHVRAAPVKVFWNAGMLVLLVVAVLSITRGLSVTHFGGPPTEAVELSPTSLGLIALLVGLVLFVLWQLRRARKHRTTYDRFPGSPRARYLRLAQTIEAELLRRAEAKEG